MNMCQILAICLFLISLRFVKSKEIPIKNVVVLMLENRSYDHMLGWMKQGGQFGNPEVNGLNGTEFNYRNIRFPQQGKVYVRPDAVDCSPYDPSHSFENTTSRIYDCLFQNINLNNSKITSPCINHGSTNGTATMGGFVHSAIVEEKKDGKTEMDVQLCSNVPIITTLANEFTQFDNYFASYPGPTNPNRLFVHTGTCDGCVGNEQDRGQIKNKTIQEAIDKHNLTWKYYYEEDAEGWFLFISYFNDHFTPEKFPAMEQFYQDAANGVLPNYSFINPSGNVNPQLNNTKSYGLMNDQHPDHSIREGERLMKNVYEALRNSPQWNETLFIITYDEHGGFYDHVPPPQVGVPNPDGKKNSLGFDFTRLGIRVPMLLISPWIDKGVVIKSPSTEQKPFETSQFEHSSIISSVLNIFGIEEKFSKRTDWAATFDNLLLLRDEPRNDCPIELPYIPPPTPEDIERLYNRPLKDRLREKVKKLCTKMRAFDEKCGENIITYKDLNQFVNDEISRIQEN